MTNEKFRKNKFVVYFLVGIIFIAFFGVMMSKNNENNNLIQNTDPVNVEGENSNNEDEPVFCTMDAKICPDGSAVGRVAPDCEFAPCPGEEKEAKLGNHSLDNAIRDYLLSQEQFASNSKEGGVNFCKFENLNEDNQLFPYELMIVCSEYQLEDGRLAELSGVSIPVKIDYPNELSYYDLSQMTYEAPRDGGDYQADVNRIFSSEAKSSLENFSNRGLNRELREEAANHFYTPSDWQNVVSAIIECDVDTAWQAHSKEVNVNLKDGTKLYAVSPSIDDIIEIAQGAAATCGEIRIGTE